MNIEASHVLPYSNQEVWDTLFDTEVLGRLLPGVRFFEQIGPDEFDALIEVGVPAVKGVYKVAVTIEDQKPNESYRILGKGKGKQGWVRGSAVVKLAPEAGGTRVTVHADAQIGGRIAGIGQRVVEGVAKAMAAEVFAALEGEMAGRQQPRSSPLRMLMRAILAWIRGVVGSKATT